MKPAICFDIDLFNALLLLSYTQAQCCVILINVMFEYHGELNNKVAPVICGFESSHIMSVKV